MGSRTVEISADLMINDQSLPSVLQILQNVGWSVSNFQFFLNQETNLYEVVLNANVDNSFSTNDIYDHFRNDLLPSWVVVNMGVNDSAPPQNQPPQQTVQPPRGGNPTNQTNLVNVPKITPTVKPTAGLLSTFINSDTGKISTMGIVVLGMLGFIVLTQKR